MATIKKKAGLGSTIGGILGGPLGFLGGRSMDRKNQAIKDETIQPAKNGKKVMKKAKNGSFPDLNKDGKITKADILKGRGVIAKHGVGMHKMPDGKMMKNSKMGMGGKSPMMKMQYGGKAASMVPKGAKKANYGASMMSKGGKMKMGGKCKNGC